MNLLVDPCETSFFASVNDMRKRLDLEWDQHNKDSSQRRMGEKKIIFQIDLTQYRLLRRRNDKSWNKKNINVKWYLMTKSLLCDKTTVFSQTGIYS